MGLWDRKETGRLVSGNVEASEFDCGGGPKVVRLSAGRLIVDDLKQQQRSFDAGER